ncbi:MAG: 4Fe-4S binding protein [Candidatus Omnitrophica bacterium]|nr:4Fe-4S binding protein [Candidatus Omnitrophota bacterium]
MAAEADKNKCTGCGVCVDICPVGAIKIIGEKAVISNDCIDCGMCVGSCPSEAISN